MIDQVARLGIIEVDRARIGQLRQPRLVLLCARQQFGIGHGGGDHLAALLGVADGEHLHARAGRFKHAEILVDVFRIGQHVGRAGNIAQHLCRCGHGL